MKGNESLDSSERDCRDSSPSTLTGSTVSFHAEVPEEIQAAMNSFIDAYPNWDQYRLIKAAIAGFLIQNGVESRSITRLYVGNMFRKIQ